MDLEHLFHGWPVVCKSRRSGQGRSELLLPQPFIPAAGISVLGPSWAEGCCQVSLEQPLTDISLVCALFWNSFYLCSPALCGGISMNSFM